MKNKTIIFITFWLTIFSTSALVTSCGKHPTTINKHEILKSAYQTYTEIPESQPDRQTHYLATCEQHYDNDLYNDVKVIYWQRHKHWQSHIFLQVYCDEYKRQNNKIFICK